MTPPDTAASVPIKCPSCYQAKGPGCDDPVALRGQPIGQYHCPRCGVMQVAGIPHIDCDMCDGTGRLEVPQAIFDRHAEEYEMERLLDG